MIALYYYENLTLREIGEVLGVTESRVSQLHTKAVLGLRSRFQRRRAAAAQPPAGSAYSCARGAQGRRPDPQRRADRPSGEREDEPLRGDPLRGRGRQPARPVEDGSTVADFEPDEQERRCRSAPRVASFEYGDRKINLIDTPGEPSFVADTLGALRVVDAAVVVVNAVMGVEVHTERLWARADERGTGAARLREHARPRARRLLPRPRLAARRPSARTSSRPRSRSAPSTRSAG